MVHYNEIQYSDLYGVHKKDLLKYFNKYCLLQFAVMNIFQLEYFIGIFVFEKNILERGSCFK
jgi:hypothetical protein